MKTTNDFPTINERPPEGRKDDGTSFRVLVVDDSMFVAKQLGQILSSEGYEIIATAADGKEGVDKYKELCPNVDLVTMDITMPKMDGITAQAVTKLHELGFRFDLTPPALFVGQKMEIAALGGTTDSVEALIVPLISDCGKIEVNVSIRERA
jgi:CheY-like chemotaxis protein